MCNAANETTNTFSYMQCYAICYKDANRVFFESLGLDSSLQIVIKKVCIWSQIYPICNIERQVTTNCFHHSCYSNH